MASRRCRVRLPCDGSISVCELAEGRFSLTLRQGRNGARWLARNLFLIRKARTGSRSA